MAVLAREVTATVLARIETRCGVRLDASLLEARARHMKLAPPGLVSANGSCHMVRCADGWLAVNLPRPGDIDMAPAWLETDVFPAGTGGAWDLVHRLAAARKSDELVERASLLGLAVSAPGMVRPDTAAVPVLRAGAPARRTGRLSVVDLSALWAGPLCGSILGLAGAAVVKLEDPSRPDTTRDATPGFFNELNGMKSLMELSLGASEGRARLGDLVADCDVLITSARPRAFAGLGLSPQQVFAANPKLVWVCITAHGCQGPAAERVGFGDDAAVAGGLFDQAQDGAPVFCGDALADPLCGVFAADAALEALEGGGGVMLDAALSKVAAWVATSTPEGHVATASPRHAKC